MTTFTDVLQRRLRGDAGQPLVTFYDDATGERVELSVATYANWVAKTASLLAEEADARRGGTLLLDLPTHWLGPVFLGAAWTVGLVVDGVATGSAAAPDVVVCGPARVDHWAADPGRPVVLACALRPLAVRFAEPLPAGVRDVGVEVWSQPDAFVPWDPPTGDDIAVPGRSQRELFGAEAGAEPVGRLLTTHNPTTPAGLDTFVQPLVEGGSTVWVAHADPAAWARKAQAERVTAVRGAPG